MSANKKMSSALTFYNDKEMSSQLSDYKDEISKWQSRLDEMEDKYYKQFSANGNSTCQSPSHSKIHWQAC